jgi:hypothetical protein
MTRGLNPNFARSAIDDDAFSAERLLCAIWGRFKGKSEGATLLKRKGRPPRDDRLLGGFLGDVSEPALLAPQGP